MMMLTGAKTTTMRMRTFHVAILLLLPIVMQLAFVVDGFFLQSTTTRTSSSHGVGRLQMSSTETEKQPGTANLQWDQLGFEYRPTNSHIRIKYKEGEGWGKPELVKEPYIEMNIAATVLHYGQSCFEGLKAFCHQDGSVHLFRPDENAQRMQRSCSRLLMPELPTEMFVNACKEVVKDNIEYVPPYGSGGAMYVRPFLFGTGPRIGVQPADEYVFIIMVIPVGDYYAGGLAKPVNGLIVKDYDRAAPRGVGNVKVAGNYAADLLPNTKSKAAGYQIGLYLDSGTQTYIDEFSTSNFVGIDLSKNTYVTPKSPSALRSITNKSLMQLAEERLGMKVEFRPVPIDELNTFDEVLAVGTAVVTTPVGSLTNLDADGNVEKTYEFGEGGKIGEKTMELYKLVRAIQNGEEPAPDGWTLRVQ